MPVAKQLRFVVAAVKANSELERIGDYAEAIARRAVTVSEAETISQRDEIVEMSRHATEMLRNAMAAFLDDDPAVAVRTLDADNRVDEMNSAIFTALAHAPVQHDDLTIRFALLGIVSRIERVADRACNIAEDAVYVSSGEVMRHLGREDNRVLFLCDHNSCRSQMAEGIARAIAPENFIFASAGTDPASAIDRRAVEFLSREGIDISRQRPKVVADVGPIEDFHVVVTLTRAAEDACPPVPYHAVALNWRLTDPSRSTGSDEEIEAVYQQLYETLRSKITEMIEAFEQGLEQ
jgi:arsenate reductase